MGAVNIQNLDADKSLVCQQNLIMQAKNEMNVSLISAVFFGFH